MFTPIWPSAVASWSGLILLFFAMPTSTLFTSSSSGVMTELSPLLDLQALLDQHVRGLLLQGRGWLFLGGDGEKALALLDVVDGDRIVVDEHDDRLLGLRLCRHRANRPAQSIAASSAPTAMQVHRVSFKYATTVEGHPRGGRGTDAGSSLLIVACASKRVGAEGAERVGLILIGAEIFQRQIHHHSLVGLDVLILNVALLVGDGQRQAVVWYRMPTPSLIVWAFSRS